MTNTGTDDHEAFPVLVLAAGASRRMGRAKALLPLSAGTLLDHAIGQAKQLGTPVTVVAGGWYPLVRYRCRVQPSAWVFARHWREGMSESLKAGLDSPGARARGVFVVLLDQPLITPGALARLADAARRNPSRACAADLQGKPGAPAYIPRHLWPQIMRLKGDRGAAAILASNGAATIAMTGAESDVDTPGDWSRVRRQLAEKS
ncbi:nucleotidyltransferase family protein [Marinobacter orientalis]|uniref:Nucleotidyltransferase family protein n=1 Tax=Marinobacter orientalis TaxID=1928859 RepID=A0A7Y0RE91_9GAMM|nr:nucleotidyltransferase family protein [Marinobacter orientalis]NMT64642.1 nucleotidyltransferase family protein [Marinobacter orientalis]TGX48323.1 nucleotidyltransferase family protein [Marinobacter orientalis]